jgi:hypothetical protein
MKACRECGHPVSEQAFACPQCGSPCPAQPEWTGWGFEYRSGAEVFGLPLLHISFKYRPNRTPVVARGVIAVGQFAAGVVTISQFGLGLVSLSQFTVAGYAIAQFALAWSLVAQFGLYVQAGRGQLVMRLGDLLAALMG